MKIKRFISFIVAILVINAAYSQQLGWSFDDVVRLKGKDYSNATPKDGTYAISYKTDKSIVNGKEYPVGTTEVYRFKSITNTVQRYTFIGLKRESDVIEIIDRNNSKFKKVDMGSKQNYYQWIDVQNSAEYTLSIQMPLEDNKFILYDCEIKGN